MNIGIITIKQRAPFKIFGIFEGSIAKFKTS